MKACLISGLMTGSGKTTFTLGLLAALRKRGSLVQPFKVGPDFIDPGLHEIAAGVPSHNLDGWMLPRAANEWLFGRACSGKDVAVVEGVMGLFDGFDGRSEAGSSAELARWLGLKVVLVVDASAMARSAAALVHGMKTFDPQVEIVGVVFNRVAGPAHFQILADAVNETPVLGWLPVERAIEIPERHLGLLTAQEELPLKRIAELGAFIETHIDIDRLLQLLPGVEPYRSAGEFPLFLPAPSVGRKPRTVRIALAHDEAFSFYYQANRLALEHAGASIVEFSPIHDKELPPADFLYIGGGYPELYREALSANRSMRQSVRSFVESGLRFYAECGGLMYLCEAIEGLPMAGVLPAAIEMTERPVDFGYCDVTTRRKSILGPAGTVARGHQFHYSRLVPEEAAEPGQRSEPPDSLYQVRQRTREYLEGFVLPNGVASYVHLHFLSNLELARNMLESSG